MKKNNKITSFLILTAMLATIFSALTIFVPSNFEVASAQANRSATITITWQSTPAATNGYDIRYKRVTESTWQTIHTNSLTATLTGLAEGSAYDVEVYPVLSDYAISTENTPLMATTRLSVFAPGELIINYDQSTPDYLDTAIRNALTSAGLANGSSITTARIIGTGTITSGSGSGNAYTLGSLLPNCTLLDLTGFTGTFGASAFYTDFDYGPNIVDTVLIPPNKRLSDAMFDSMLAMTTLAVGTNTPTPGVVDLTGYTAGSFGNYAFGSCSGITTVRLPNGIPLSNGLFSSCSSLDTLMVGTSPFVPGVIDLWNFSGSIGTDVFAFDRSITTVKWPFEDIPKGTFDACTNLSKVFLPLTDFVDYMIVGDYAFESRPNFYAVTGTVLRDNNSNIYTGVNLIFYQPPGISISMVVPTRAEMTFIE